jgi:drug/metabolite transporter (DMT)-like permease
MGSKEWSLILILSMIWGGSFFFIEVAVAEMTPLTIVWFRVTIAALVLLGYVYFSGRTLPASPRILGSFFILGALGNVIPFSLIVWGQQYIEGGLAAILNATTPIFSVILAHFFTTDEQLTTNRMVGVLVGWIGVAVLIGIDSLRGFGMYVIGQTAVLGAALSYACAAIYGRRFQAISPPVVSAGMLTCSALMMIPLALIFEEPFALSPSLTAWGALLGLSVISTSLAYIIYFRILATSGATNSLLVTFLIPITAILLGVFVLGEQFRWNAFGGMALIFTGLMLIDGRMIAKLRRKRART